MPRDGWSTIGITVRAPNAGATLTNTAKVDPNGAISERDESNNAASVTSTANPPPPPPPLSDLTITSFTAAPPVQFVGFYETYTIKVHNNGPGAAAAIRFRWHADWNNGQPRNITQVMSNADSLFMCYAPLYDYVGQEVECSGGSLGAGATATITLSVLGANSPISALTTATVDPYGNIQETDETNNQATVTTVFS